MNKRIRFEIFKRDNFTCVYCGRQTPTVVLEVDHVIPKAEGGSDDTNNLVTACFDCNRGKGKIKLNKSMLVDNRKEEAEELLELQEQIKEYEKAIKQKKAAEKRAIKRISKVWEEASDGRFCFTDSGESTIAKFLKNLTPNEIVEAIEIAANRIPSDTNEGIDNRFKYLCGICHNKIAEKNGDNSKYLYNKIKKMWMTQKRGSGYMIDWQLKDICKMYEEEDIIDAIEEAYSTRRSSYWQTFKDILGYEE